MLKKSVEWDIPYLTSLIIIFNVEHASILKLKPHRVLKAWVLHSKILLGPNESNPNNCDPVFTTQSNWNASVAKGQWSYI